MFCGSHLICRVLQLSVAVMLAREFKLLLMRPHLECYT